MSGELNSHFGAVVDINADIQRVVTESRRLYLVSLNAMFLARRTGGRAAAFQRVTGEMRQFSDRMQREMNRLRQCVGELLRGFSESRRHQRALALVERAERLARGAGWSGTLEGSRERAARLRAALSLSHHRFMGAVADSLRLCGIGENLSVLAKVEAAASDREGLLRLGQVAEELAELVDTMRAVLERARRQVELIEA